MYQPKALLLDAGAYGRVLYVAQGSSLVFTDPAYTSAQPHAAFTAEADSFLHGTYAFVRTDRRLTIYRAYGDERAASARMLSRYWSATRPSLAIDRLGYESHHNRLRHDQAVLPSWNPLSQVVEAHLAAGAEVFVGRAAPQSGAGDSYAGGAIQLFLNTASNTGQFVEHLPRVSYQLTLMRRHTVGRGAV